MNKVLNDKKASMQILIVCFAAYTIMSFTRNAYTAAIAGIVNDGIFSKTDSGIINSSFYIFYMFAQILGACYVDKISPFKLLTIGFLGTVVSNIAMSASASFWVVFSARAFSGIVQFGTWPALLKIISEYVCADYRRKAMYIMPLGVTAGTVLSFLIAFFVLNFGNWQELFRISYLLMALVTIIYFISVHFAKKKEEQKNIRYSNEKDELKGETGISFGKLLISSGGVFLCTVVLIKNLIAFGMSSWMPTMIMESYSVSPGFSSVLTAVSSFSNFAAVFLVTLLYPGVFKNQPVAVGMFFLMSLPMAAVLIFIGKIPVILVVVLITFVNMFNNAIHQFFTVEIPSAYINYNKAGMMAGIFNAFACMGNVIAGFVFGYIADEFGWDKTVSLWAILMLLGFLVSFAAVPAWKKFKRYAAL